MESAPRKVVEATMVIPRVGRLIATEDPLHPYRLVDQDDVSIDAVDAFFSELMASHFVPGTLRSYGVDLLRWFRFCWATGISPEHATTNDAREFCLLLQVAPKPIRPHWRHPEKTDAPVDTSSDRLYSPAVRAHSESVLRLFYDFCGRNGYGPKINPFPLALTREARRAHAHHNPMEPHRNERVGRYRPSIGSRIPRAISDGEFNEIFAKLRSNRDRALVAFYVSTGARATELLSVTQGSVDPGRQLITVRRKGTKARQELPASSDAFVFLRLYQLETEGLVPQGKRQPLFWTLRRPFHPLTYHGAHRMFERVNADAKTSATLHSLRHTAAYRMASDPKLPLTDVQWVLGHAHLSTTQIYLTARKEDVIARVLAHHVEQTEKARREQQERPVPTYRKETLEVLFGRSLP